MRVCILGWYGTETLGDRAILGGIFRFFSEYSKENVFCIGSLYPFFTERTLLEEQGFYSELSCDAEISCFDVRCKKRLREEIMKADIVLMGGGPLMDMFEMELILSSFKYAKKKHRKTALWGCGIGPLRGDVFKSLTREIVKYCDIVILRDSKSKIILEQMLGTDKEKKDIYVCYDPAFLGVDIRCRTEKKQNYGVVNLRDYRYLLGESEQEVVLRRIVADIDNMAKTVDKVYFLSNHTFVLGGDDRKFYEFIKPRFNAENIEIIHEPMSLKQTYDFIAKASVCVAMRYHAVLFQTVLNGNNFIWDYTDLHVGKISGFLEQFSCSDFYTERYMNISGEKENGFCFECDSVYVADYEELQKKAMNQYREAFELAGGNGEK